jgi:hypothetical protein
MGFPNRAPVIVVGTKNDLPQKKHKVLHPCRQCLAIVRQQTHIERLVAHPSAGGHEGHPHLV